MAKIVYVGMHKETLPLLYDTFDISAVAYFPIFQKRTFNPVNYIFKSVYFLRKTEKLRFLEMILLKLWLFSKSFSSSVFYDYSEYLVLMSNNKTRTLDFDNAIEVEDYIKKNNIDLLVVNTWEMLPDAIIFAPKLGTINVHPSKLPKYRGALPTLWALKNGDSETAITCMLLDHSVDGGSIIGQHEFSLDEKDDWLSVEKKATAVILETLVDDLVGYIEGRIKPRAQDLSIGSFTDKYEKYKRIDWEMEKGRDVYNKVNLYPFVDPDIFCYTYHKNRRVFIKSASFCQGFVDGKDKSKFCIKGRYLCVNMSDGIIKLKLFRDLGFVISIYAILRGSNFCFYSNK